MAQQSHFYILRQSPSPCALPPAEGNAAPKATRCPQHDGKPYEALRAFPQRHCVACAEGTHRATQLLRPDP